MNRPVSFLSHCTRIHCMQSFPLSHQILTSCLVWSCTSSSSFCASHANVLNSRSPSSLIPTVFLPLSLLSYGSLLGITSTVFLIGVVFVDGLTKFDAPGSLWSPARTSFRFCNLEELGLAFGLFMAGVCNILAFHVMSDFKAHKFSSVPTQLSHL